MNKKIFLSSFLASLAVLLVSFVLVFGVLFEHFENQMFNELKSEALYISYAVENEGTAYINKLKNEAKRITLVSADGTVLADTATQVSELDNHANRKEIKDAQSFGSGSSSRYSDTLTEKTLYYAVRMSDGNVLRVSATQKSVFIILLGLIQPLVLIVMAALALSLVLSRRVSKAIIKPINNIDLDNPENNETYEELTPFLRKISNQNRTIKAQIEEAKQKQEEFKLITENMSEGLLVIDSESNVLTYNQAALRLLEIDEIGSGGVFTLNRTKTFRDVVGKALNGERTESEITFDERNFELIASPVPQDGQIIGAVIVIIDVTESVKREQLRREFTSNVSHELKTPLTSIFGFAEIMKSGGTPDATVVDFSTSIYEEAQRLITLVSDIMKISELDENSVQLDKENVDLLELSKNVLRRLKPYADKQGITLKIKGDVAQISGVKKILDEMIYNLCDNAIKYNKHNGSVEVNITENDESVEMSVSDTGIGIAQSEQNRIFERFYRVDKSHSKEIGGTGLGLAIVKHGAIYHNAEISIESAVDHGTSITIKFRK